MSLRILPDVVVAQRGSLIELELAIITILFHIVKKHLHLALALESLSPMG
jgi:hypothetical protein